MHEIIFDRNNSYWSKDEGFNLLFLRTQERYLNDLAKSKGYLYFNEIYEVLGSCWNQEEENECLIYNDKYIRQLEFEVFHEKDGKLRILILTPKKES